MPPVDAASHIVEGSIGKYEGYASQMSVKPQGLNAINGGETQRINVGLKLILHDIIM